jgi:glycosyltransferase involved in cell wall biosynthesis
MLEPPTQPHLASPKRVLFRYSSHQYDTGSPKSLVSMISLLLESNYEPWYLATGKGPLLDKLKSLGVNIIYDNVFELSIKSPWHAIGRIKYYRRKLLSLKINILHMNEFGWNQDIVLAAKTLNIPVVLHCHNDTKISYQNLNRFAASKVLTVSKKQLEKMENKAMVEGKCDYLYNTLNIPYISQASSIRNILGYTENEIIIGTVAQISHRKGIDIIIETAKLLLPKYERLRFVIVGPTGGREDLYFEEIKQKVVKYELTQKVDFLGSRGDIPDLLATFDLFFLPTRHEPFGMVFTEALAAGLPIVASDVGGIPEIISSSDLGLLVNGVDPKLYSTAIESILNLPDNGFSLGKAGQESLKGRFDEDTIRKKLVGIYDSLTNLPI